MDFTTRTEVEAPIGYVFDQLSDFAGFEQAARRRGAEVLRTDRQDEAGLGAQWRASFAYAGKPRQMTLELDEYDRPERMRFALGSKNLTGELIVELTALSGDRSRMQVKLRLRPVTMTARVLLQGLRLAKARSLSRMQERVALYARGVEARFAGAA